IYPRVSAAQKAKVFLRNVIEHGFASAFRAFQLGKVHRQFLEIVRFEKTHKLRLASGAGERDVDGFNDSSANKVGDQVDLLNDGGRAFYEAKLRAFGLRGLEV